MTLRSRIVDGIFNGLELFAATYDFVRKLQRRVRRDTDPVFPLTHKDAERIAEFGRRAGHEQGYNSPKVVTETLKLPKPPRVPRI